MGYREFFAQLGRSMLFDVLFIVLALAAAVSIARAWRWTAGTVRAAWKRARERNS
jgi:hypothetical protein